MPELLDRPTARERLLADQLREQSIEVIENIGIDAAAAQLDLVENGVRALMARSHWPLQRAYRVADALGIVVPAEVIPPTA